MILPLREIDVMGVFMAPFAVCLPIAFAATLIALALLRRMPGMASVSRSPGLELSAFVAILSALVLRLGRF